MARKKTPEELEAYRQMLAELQARHPGENVFIFDADEDSHDPLRAARRRAPKPSNPPRDEPEP